jgi:hypothetical protein
MENKIVCYRNMHPRPDLVGKKYGQWTILEDLGARVPSCNGTRHVKARCGCGVEKVVPLSNIKRHRLTKCLACAQKTSAQEALAGRLNNIYDNPDPYLGTSVGDWVLVIRIYIDGMMPGYYGVSCVNQLHSAIKNIHAMHRGKGLTCRECNPAYSAHDRTTEVT